MVFDAIESIGPAAEGKGIRLTKVLDPKGGPISSDPNRISRLSGISSPTPSNSRRAGRVQVLLKAGSIRTLRLR